MRKDGEFELYKQKHSPALATIEGIPFKEYELDLYPGDCLFVYTDGVPEAINEQVDDYGTDRLVEVLNAHKTEALDVLLPMVRKDIEEFVGEAEQFDDVTMLGFRYQPMEIQESPECPETIDWTGGAQ
jgi:serine phosphatase RsbU (regulator of sigma subunit)